MQRWVHGIVTPFLNMLATAKADKEKSYHFIIDPLHTFTLCGLKSDTFYDASIVNNKTEYSASDATDFGHTDGPTDKVLIEMRGLIQKRVVFVFNLDNKLKSN